MKRMLFALAMLAAAAAIAAPIVESNPAGVSVRRQAAAQEGIKSLRDWVSLTNDRAAYVADKAAYTGQVAQVTDVQTRQAIRALAACVQDCQAQINDLKRVVLAIANGSTNNAIINQ